MLAAVASIVALFALGPAPSDQASRAPDAAASEAAEAALRFVRAFASGEGVNKLLASSGTARRDQYATEVQQSILTSLGYLKRALVVQIADSERLQFETLLRCGNGAISVTETLDGDSANDWYTPVDIVLRASRVAADAATPPNDAAFCSDFRETILFYLTSATPIDYSAATYALPQPDIPLLSTTLRGTCGGTQPTIAACSTREAKPSRVVTIETIWAYGTARFECSVLEQRVVSVRMNEIHVVSAADNNEKPVTREVHDNLASELASLRTTLSKAATSLPSVSTDGSGAEYVSATSAGNVVALARVRLSGILSDAHYDAPAASSYISRKVTLPKAVAMQTADHGVTNAVPRSALQSAMTAVSRFVDRLSAAPTLTPDIFIASAPTGAQAVLSIGDTERPPIMTDDWVKNVWIGVYLCRVNRTGYKPATFTIDLVDDPRNSFQCELAPLNSSGESSCRPTGR